MENITVVDSIMGSGKTTWAIEKIRESEGEKFIYITPYLEEIERVKKLTKDKHRMYEPVYKGNSKSNHFHEMLASGKSICSTHALFQNASNVTREALGLHDYVLVLDEVMDVVEQLFITQDDLKMLFDNNLVYVENDYLLWNRKELDYRGKFENLKSMALNKNLIFIGGKLLFWNFPVDIFKYFKEVYILTYMFDAQIQKYYYDYHGIECKKFQVDENHELVPYTEERRMQDVKKIAPLINIYEGKLNRIGEGEHTLSKSWFERNSKTMETVLKNNLVNWFNNINKEYKSNSRIWTTFKDSRTKIGGKGYSKRFVSLNMRATNNYINSAVLAYCCNRYAKPTIKVFFSNRNIQMDEDMYAISEMIQWIWRSRIRCGEEIYIYVPSKRMRNLLKQYLMM